MWTEKTNGRCVLILGCLALLPLLGGCGQRDLTRDKAAEMLGQHYAEKATQACALDASLRSKPEFSALVSEPVCEAEFVVTGIRKVSDTMVIVDAKMVRHARKDAVGKWLEAFDALQGRLLGLEPIRLYCGFAGCSTDPPKDSSIAWKGFWVFKDDTDGQEFSREFGYTAPPADIKETDTWKSLQKEAKFVASLAEAGSLDADHWDTLAQPFQLFDDGWRLVQDD